MSQSLIHLLHRAGQLADEAFGAHVGGDARVTPRQLVVLAAIDALPDPSQTQLVDKTGIDRSTMADIVRRLSRNGLVARKRTRADGRRYAVRLTDKGRRALEGGIAASDAANLALLKRVPPTLRKSFQEALRFLALGKVITSDSKLVAAE